MTNSSVLIKFSDINSLHECLKSICSIHISSGTASATDCILVEQISSNVTRFTTQTPNRSAVTWEYQHLDEYSGGVEGQEYLLLKEDLLKKIKQIKAGDVDALVMKQVTRGVQISGVKLNPSTGKNRTVHRLIVRQYNGDVSDFPPPFKAQKETVAVVNGVAFERLCSLTSMFGGFSKEDKISSDIVTATILLAAWDGELVFLAENMNKCRAITQQVKSHCQQDNDRIFGIDGIHLSCLKSIQTNASVVIRYEEKDFGEWLTFYTKTVNVSMRVVNTGLRVKLNSGLYDYESNCMDLQFRRQVNALELNNACMIQEPTSISSNLLMTEHEGEIQIQDPEDLQANQASWVPMNPDLVEGDFIDFLISQQAIILAYRASSAQYATADEEQPALEFKLSHYIKRKKRLKSCSYGLSIIPTYQSSSITQSFFCLTKAAAESIDELDVKE